MPVTNSFEQAVHDCMIPTAELLEETTKPLHRAILLTFWRHVLEAERGERFCVLNGEA